MKTEKLVKSLFAPKSVGTTSQVIGLISGMAAGIVLGVLFAPGSGKSARERIIKATRGLINSVEEEVLVVENEIKDQEKKKKPKSDIKELIHQAHVTAAHAEQEIV